MSSFKLVCVAATLVASMAATSAFADCSRSQEITLGQATTLRHYGPTTVGTQHQKPITLHDCDAS